MHFSIYLAMTMERLTGENWSRRILPHIRNTYLVRYQAAVSQEDWRKVWDTLLKPFGEQQATYKKHHKTKIAPEILFGVEARPCEDTEQRDHARSDSSNRTGTPESTSPRVEDPRRSDVHSNSNTVSNSTTTASARADSSEVGHTDSSDGIPLPRAAAWLEFWESAEIPEHNTFVDFAGHVDESGFFRRVSSAPDLQDLENDDDAGDSSPIDEFGALPRLRRGNQLPRTLRV
jgi:hypothetical protein